VSRAAISWSIFASIFSHVLLNIAMVIPRLTSPMPQLNITNTSLQQTSRDQRLPTINGAAIQFM
jgi:hypothetical protein